MAFLEQFDFQSSVRDYDYTLRSKQNLERIKNSKDFRNKSAETIFQYLYNQMELVSFNDFLKRYVYTISDIQRPFSSVSDEEFREIIVSTFKENNAPFSFHPTVKRPTAIVKGWLTYKSGQRNIVFLLGFGLKMSPRDVSQFLTSVLKEHDFDFSDPKETIFWYCFRNKLPYSCALKLYEESVCADSSCDSNSCFDCNHSVRYVKNDRKLLAYLSQLRTGNQKNYDDFAYYEFERLLNHTKHIIAQIYTDSSRYVEDEKNRKWCAEEITIADIEKILCDGIPFDKNGNIKNTHDSVLAEHFHYRNFSRQHISNVLKQKTKVNRFDLITLLFFIYSQDANQEQPENRCCAFVDEINEILKNCGMAAIYPVNPYESFILMALLSQDPFVVYSEVLELSYQQAN